MDQLIEVRVHPEPMYIRINADHFGKLFADMSDIDQIAVLRAMVEHMRPFRTQWDFMAISLKKPENQAVAQELFDCLGFALENTRRAEDKLREAANMLGFDLVARDNPPHSQPAQIEA